MVHGQIRRISNIHDIVLRQSTIEIKMKADKIGQRIVEMYILDACVVTASSGGTQINGNKNCIQCMIHIVK